MGNSACEEDIPGCTALLNWSFHGMSGHLLPKRISLNDIMFREVLKFLVLLVKSTLRSQLNTFALSLQQAR